MRLEPEPLRLERDRAAAAERVEDGRRVAVGRASRISARAASSTVSFVVFSHLTSSSMIRKSRCRSASCASSVGNALGPARRVVDERGEEHRPAGRQRPPRPPQVQRRRVPVPDRLLARRRAVDRLERQRDLDQLLAVLTGASLIRLSTVSRIGRAAGLAYAVSASAAAARARSRSSGCRRRGAVTRADRARRGTGSPGCRWFDIPQRRRPISQLLAELHESRPRTFCPTSVPSSCGRAPQKDPWAIPQRSAGRRSRGGARRTTRQFCASLTRRHQRMTLTRTHPSRDATALRYGLLVIFAVIGLRCSMISCWTSRFVRKPARLVEASEVGSSCPATRAGSPAPCSRGRRSARSSFETRRTRRDRTSASAVSGTRSVRPPREEWVPGIVRAHSASGALFGQLRYVTIIDPKPRVCSTDVSERTLVLVQMRAHVADAHAGLQELLLKQVAPVAPTRRARSPRHVRRSLKVNS